MKDMTFWEAVEQHRLIRRLLLLWIVVFVSVVTAYVLVARPAIDPEAAHVVEIITGFAAAVIALYKWLRSREDGGSKEEDS